MFMGPAPAHDAVCTLEGYSGSSAPFSQSEGKKRRRGEERRGEAGRVLDQPTGSTTTYIHHTTIRPRSRTTTASDEKKVHLLTPASKRRKDPLTAPPHTHTPS